MSGVNQETATQILLQPDFAKQQPLLHFAPPMILVPSIIEDDTFIMLSWSIELARKLHGSDLPIQMRINGMGGLVTTTTSMIDLIQLDGNVQGFLYGQNYSAHSVLWAACPERYVLPSSSIHVHGASRQSTNRENRMSQTLDLEEIEHLDRQMATVYADACDRKEYDTDYWYKLLYTTTPSACKVIRALELVDKYRMGKPLGKIK